MYKLIIIHTIILFCAAQAISQININRDVKTEEKYPVKTVNLQTKEFEFTGSGSIKYNKYNDNIYITDKSNYQVAVFDKDLNFITSTKRMMDSNLTKPFAISFDSNGKIILADFTENIIRIFDLKFNLISEFKEIYYFSGYNNDIHMNSEGKMYLNLLTKGYLFTVCDGKGTEIDRFEKLNIIDHDKRDRYSVQFALDDENNIYCVFKHHPVLLKYNKNHNPVFEKRLEYLPGIERFLNKTKKEKNETLPGLHFKFISVDNMNIYLGVKQESNLVFVFDKNNGILVKRLYLKTNGRFNNFEFRTKDYFYAVDDHYKRLLKFKK